MIWTKPLAWFLVGSSRLPLAAPVTSECIPYSDVCYAYATFPNAGTDFTTSRRKREYRDVYALKNGSMILDTNAKVVEYAINLKRQVKYLAPEDQVDVVHAKWQDFATRLQNKLEIHWYVQCRAAIELFEIEFGQTAKINYEALPDSLTDFERTTRVRKMIWMWMLQNCEDYKVTDLKALIEKSTFFKNIEEFADGIARAFNDLSNYINRKVMVPGNRYVQYKYDTLDTRANQTIEMFMSMFEIKDFIVVQKTQDST